MTKAGEVEEDKTTVFYNVEDISGTTPIFNNNTWNSVLYYVVDDTTKVNVTNNNSRYYQFDTAGVHSVKFYYRDNTALPANFLRGVPNIIKVVVPNNITSIGIFCIYNCSATEWIIGTGMATIGNGQYTWGSCQKLTIYATTPPSLADYSSLGGSFPIYVPSESTALYQAADYWKNHPIYAITE